MPHINCSATCAAILALLLNSGCPSSEPAANPSSPSSSNTNAPTGGSAAGTSTLPGPLHSITVHAASTSVRPDVSVTGDSGASRAVISADGRWIVLTSSSTDHIDRFQDLLVQQPPYLFLHDCETGTNVLIDHAFTTNNEPGNAMSDFADISADGQFVVFEGHGSNLVPGFPREGGHPQVYRYDRESNNNALISFTAIIDPNDPQADTHLPTPGASYAPRISDDGRFTCYLSSGMTIALEQQGDVVGSDDVFLYDAQEDKNVLVSHVVAHSAKVGNGSCQLPNISADGQFVAFLSDSTNLIDNQSDVNGSASDLFLYDRTTRLVTLISHAHDSVNTTCDGGVVNSTAPQLSDDGRFVVYVSSSTDLVSGMEEPDLYIYLYDRETGENILVSHTPENNSFGGYGVAEAPVISGDGNWIAYESEAGELGAGMDSQYAARNIYLYDRVHDATFVVSHTAGSTQAGGAENAFFPSISRDGRYVSFYSDAPDHVAGQDDSPQGFDVFVYDHQTRGISLVSHLIDSPATSAGDGSDMGLLAADHPVIIFRSDSPQLVELDKNNTMDVFWAEIGE